MSGYTNTAGVWVPTRNTNLCVFVFGYMNSGGGLGSHPECKIGWYLCLDMRIVRVFGFPPGIQIGGYLCLDMRIVRVFGFPPGIQIGWYLCLDIRILRVFGFPPGFRRDLILQGLGPPCLRGRPGRRQDLLIQGLARYAPRAPRAARAPKQFINTGLGPPFALGPLRRPGRRKYLLISPRAPQPASLRAEGPAIFFDVVLFF